jgi:hypothetical protein
VGRPHVDLWYLETIDTPVETLSRDTYDSLSHGTVVRRSTLQSRLLSLRAVLRFLSRTEIHRHDLSHFVDEPPSVAQGGNGVVVPGCPTCRKRFGTMLQFLDHLTDDVLPAVLDRLSTEK